MMSCIHGFWNILKRKVNLFNKSSPEVAYCKRYHPVSLFSLRPTLLPPYYFPAPILERELYLV